MVLTARQQLARTLANELGKMPNVWVTSALPLDEHQRLRLQVADIVKNETIQVLRDWGWDPVFVSILPRVCPTGLMAACLWEVDIPKPRQPVVDDRTIHGEIAKPAKTSVELEGIRKYLGLK